MGRNNLEKWRWPVDKGHEPDVNYTDCLWSHAKDQQRWRSIWCAWKLFVLRHKRKKEKETRKSEKKKKKRNVTPQILKSHQLQRDESHAKNSFVWVWKTGHQITGEKRPHSFEHSQKQTQWDTNKTRKKKVEKGRNLQRVKNTPWNGRKERPHKERMKAKQKMLRKRGCCTFPPSSPIHHKSSCSLTWMMSPLLKDRWLSCLAFHWYSASAFRPSGALWACRQNTS